MTPIDLPRARRDLIAERLAAGQAVVATELAEEFSISEDAIRRDLRALAADGRCRRVYGGAIPIAANDRPMAARLREAPGRKTALAQAGARTVQPGELVFLDASSANVALVDYLPEDADLTIATNAVDVAAAVLRRQDLRLLMIGGEVDRHLGGCFDAAATASLSRLRIDRCFIGVCAVTLTDGVMATHFSEVVFKQTLLTCSRTRVALATTDKLSASAPYRVAEVSELHTLILESDAAPAIVNALKDAGAPVIQAEAAR